MPTFHYSAIDSAGRKVQSSIEAVDRRTAQRKLAARALRPLSLSEKSAAEATLKGPRKISRPALPWLNQSTAETREATGRGSQPLDFAKLFKRSPKTAKGTPKHGLAFLKRLLELHSSGMPVGDCIRLLNQRLSDPVLKAVAHDVWRELSEGRTLADALSTRPDLFPVSVLRVVEAGEATGKLAPIIERIVAYLEERQEVRSKVLGGLAYPVFIACSALGVAVFLIVFLLPRVQGMLDSLGGTPNIFMRILLGSADIAITTGPYLAALAVLGVIGIAQWRKTPKGKITTDFAVLKIPLIGNIMTCGEYFQLSNLLKTLIESGINMTETLRLCERTLGNAALSERFKQTRSDVNEGVGLAHSLRTNGLFNDLAIDILSIGENTGNLVHSLEEINKAYRRELDETMKLMTQLITSAAMAFGFALVALVAIAMVTSILQVSTSISISG